jgi:hypothetical protein
MNSESGRVGQHQYRVTIMRGQQWREMEVTVNGDADPYGAALAAVQARFPKWRLATVEEVSRDCALPRRAAGSAEGCLALAGGVKRATVPLREI